MPNPNTSPRTAVIGAGPAGLACAQLLRQAGHDPVVFEKSRGIGGRMATRRRDGVQFDHGAQGIVATTEAGAAWLDAAGQAGHAAQWPGGAALTGTAPWVGTPGMSALCRPLAEGLDIRFSTEVTGAERHAGGWRLQSADRVEVFDRVAVAIPAPQVLRIFGGMDSVSGPLADVVMAPCWALMAAFDAPVDAPPVIKDADPFELILRDSDKPGRPGGECWVAHATAEWTRANLELDRDEVRDRLLAALAERLGPLPPVRIAMAHRWRFAQTERALGQEVLAPEDGLFIGGDWTRGALAEDACLSGQAMARALLASLGAG
ncbi:NAD(P)/FAD-dependent oxidoreductase [Aestuariicoccus sp. MJ-SS9]|uniref:NAD(P)/FAD-dependent oxidoreductase n=1 Tax=Aestuariicoccus sp. MJ-SS9 TaxID=3079855 RepID=UPI00290ADB2B|nr:FAD-dependent oxidoreductase [Aestuariicoccus sp. MJ-SS9]MDU8911933.1 FAD-dependent oxidoreductase [Aestuariicoccus sp. MJ-SS9]